MMPKDYDELFREYYPIVCSLVRKNPRVRPEHREDIVAHIFERFVARDILANYRDENFEGGFHRYVMANVKAYCRGRSEMYALAASRQCSWNAMTEFLDADEFEFPAHIVSIDPIADAQKRLELLEEIAALREKLPDHLKPVLDASLEAFRTHGGNLYGRIDCNVVGEILGLSYEQTRLLVKELTAYLRGE